MGEAMNAPGAKTPDARQKAIAILQEKKEKGIFDVFLCHNHRDKPKIKEIGKQLMLEGVLPWLDEWELRPGFPWQTALEQQIENVQSAAVFVGVGGIGPWQEQEVDALLREFRQLKRPVIPVLLPDAPAESSLPVFLKQMTWIDFGVSDPDPMARLMWGITGKNPDSWIGALLPESPTGPPLERQPLSRTEIPALPSGAEATSLDQLLIGSWQVQITNALGMVGHMVLEIMSGGVFRGQLATPMGMTNVEGQWLLAPAEQLSLQGRQIIGFQVMPYMTVIQLKQTAPFQLVGTTSAGEQTIWQKMA
jgi:TIR domain